MASAIIDSCCLIDLLASGHAESILRASGHAWHLPVAVQGEVQFVRQRDPNDSSKIISVPEDLSALISAEVLAPCQPDVPAELDLFIRYAARFGSDGEAMCLALAENRGWLLATDDKEAMKVGQQAVVGSDWVMTARRAVAHGVAAAMPCPRFVVVDAGTDQAILLL